MGVQEVINEIKMTAKFNIFFILNLHILFIFLIYFF